jgi:hypothetical protein
LLANFSGFEYPALCLPNLLWIVCKANKKKKNGLCSPSCNLTACGEHISSERKWLHRKAQEEKRHGLVEDTSRAHCIFSVFSKKKSYQVILQKK